VDLGSVYDLSSVELFARGDCCPDRHSNLNINVYDAPSGSLVHTQYFGPSLPAPSDVSSKFSTPIPERTFPATPECTGAKCACSARPRLPRALTWRGPMAW
jgi:hypothetical protein